MTVTDKNIELAKGAANDAAADGGGITVDSGGGDKTWQWLDATDSWTSSENIRIANDKVFGFAGDTGLNIRRAGSNILALVTNGNDRIRILQSGNVGIGSLVPKVKLDVSGDTQLEGNVNVSGISTFAANTFVEGVLKVTGNTVRIEGTSPVVILDDTNNNHQYRVLNNNGTFEIKDHTNNANRFTILSNGTVRSHGNFLALSDFDVDGHTELDNVNIAGVTTTVGDVNFTGTDYNAFWDESLSALRFYDNAAIRLGNAQDLQIYHSSSGGGNSYIDNSTGILFLRNTGTNGSQIQLLKNNSGFKIQALAGEQSILGVANGQVELYHNNSKKLATTGIGATAVSYTHLPLPTTPYV